MSRIPTPAAIEAAPERSRPLLKAVEAQFGVTPAMFRLVGVSPAALEGLTGLFGALGKGALDAGMRERLALAIANVNGCTYCNSAHTYLGGLAKVDAAEIAAARAGRSSDPKVEAALRFAIQIAARRGAVSDAEFAAVRAAGWSDAEIVEIVAHVGLNVFTNYVNEVLGTEVDFPVVEAARAA